MIKQVDSQEHQNQLEATEDSDVASERIRLKMGHISALTQDNSLVMIDLTKHYKGGLVAVNKLNVGILPGECFGLLGINGAGKTSTFQDVDRRFNHYKWNSLCWRT